MTGNAKEDAAAFSRAEYTANISQHDIYLHNLATGNVRKPDAPQSGPDQAAASRPAQRASGGAAAGAGEDSTRLTT